MENKAALLAHAGGDKLHALQAWQSTGTDVGLEGDYIDVDELFARVIVTKKKICSRLLKDLAEAGHHTPFEHSFMSFQITCDLATVIQLLKHRIGVSINSESARYKELLEDKYFLPHDWDEEWLKKLEEHTREGQELYHQALKHFTENTHMGRKRAKETARYFLAYNSQVTIGVSFNFRSFMHFQGLRNSEHAQVEIHRLAENLLRLIRNIPTKPFELSLQAFGY